MNELFENLHREAMNLAAQGFVLRMQGQNSDAQILIKDAFLKEREVALSIANSYDLEPTRSVLFRSAASLAIECNELKAAEKLICSGLMGEAPDEIAEELRDLLEQVHFNRHLDLRNVSIGENEFQLSLTGQSIGFGLIKASEYSPRVKYLESLILRTEERRRSIPFRKQGAPKKEIREDIDMYISVPRAGSFAVTFRLGRQTPIPNMGLTDDLIKTLFHSLRLFNNFDLDGLKEIMHDEYLRNFIALARNLSPDGIEVKTVGLTSVSGGCEERVLMSTPREETMKIIEDWEILGDSSGEDDRIHLKGRLMEASSVKRKNGYIIVVDDQNIRHTISAPLEVMADIVKPLYEEMVSLEGIRHGKEIRMLDIYRQS